MAYWSQYTFQDAATPLIEQIILFHDHVNTILILILSSVSVFSLFLLITPFTYRKFISAPNLEIIWTIVPVALLITLALPSLHLLYLIDECGMKINSINIFY